MSQQYKAPAVVKKIQNEVILKIFMTYYGSPCKFRVKGTKNWVRSIVNHKTIENFDLNDNILLLKPFAQLTSRHITAIHRIMSDGEDNVDEHLDLSDEGIEQFREHIQDSTNLITYPVADYLRKEHFALTTFGVDLFKSNIAIEYKQMEYRGKTR